METVQLTRAQMQVTLTQAQRLYHKLLLHLPLIHFIIAPTGLAVTLSTLTQLGYAPSSDSYWTAVDEAYRKFFALTADEIVTPSAYREASPLNSSTILEHLGLPKSAKYFARKDELALWWVRLARHHFAVLIIKRLLALDRLITQRSTAAVSTVAAVFEAKLSYPLGNTAVNVPQPSKLDPALFSAFEAVYSTLDECLIC